MLLACAAGGISHASAFVLALKPRTQGDWRRGEGISLAASPLANFLGVRGKKKWRLRCQISLAPESR